MKGKKEAAILDRGADPLARFADSRIRQADNNERRRDIRFTSHRLKVDLDIYNYCVDAVNSRRLREK